MAKNKAKKYKKHFDDYDEDDYLMDYTKGRKKKYYESEDYDNPKNDYAKH